MYDTAVNLWKSEKIILICQILLDRCFDIKLNYENISFG